ncbi:MAG: 3'-5' exonuclease [Crocinitomicaceae bacterium]|nr:3'-5' exonuclease [Crocinitomicaceae bacterium]NGF75920.1 3'-5' exonuclease [Fluviicola sp. SGL-29]
MLLNTLNLEKVLFLDIETVPQVYLPQDLDEETRKLFGTKLNVSPDEIGNFEEAYFRRAGILAEFGKIICISVGFLHDTGTGRQLRLKSFYHDDEETLLLQFKRLLDEHYNTPYHLLCGHNAKEFDFPYICRRMLIHGIELPNILNMAGKKPWEIAHLDTMELWKFGDYKAYTSLALLCHVFKIPTPKDDISGADVARVYYEEKNLERIKVYCEKDVVALIQLFLRMQGEPLVDQTEVYHST